MILSKGYSLYVCPAKSSLIFLILLICTAFPLLRRRRGEGDEGEEKEEEEKLSWKSHLITSTYLINNTQENTELQERLRNIDTLNEIGAP